MFSPYIHKKVICKMLSLFTIYMCIKSWHWAPSVYTMLYVNYISIKVIRKRNKWASCKALGTKIVRNSWSSSASLTFLTREVTVCYQVTCTEGCHVVWQGKCSNDKTIFNIMWEASPKGTNTTRSNSHQNWELRMFPQIQFFHF